ncbi:MAG: hypothetical protein GF375_01905 [Candidatus Omnitrophica bacterium]|nr:hypothetical protein [Candidatus Omnitrophota bacterium]MBD3268880.1 hypothetical protein [Candidatus Omnitrophota bacterium]
MKMLITLIIAVVFSFSFLLPGFCNYDHLMGKWVKINGPESLSRLGVAVIPEACDLMNAALVPLDKKDFKEVLKSFSILRIKNHTSAIVVDIELFKNRAKVVLLSGLYKGRSGWIPISWLSGNEERPVMAEK